MQLLTFRSLCRELAAEKWECLQKNGQTKKTITQYFWLHPPPTSSATQNRYSWQCMFQTRLPFPLRVAGKWW